MNGTGSSGMARVFALILWLIGGFALAPAGAATLVGDTVTIDYLFPNSTTTYTGFTGIPRTVTVANGTADMVTASYFGTRLFSVNVDAATVQIKFLTNLSFASAAFNGLQISGIGQSLSGVTLSGATASVVSNGATSSLLFDFSGQSFRRNQTLTGTVLFAPPPPTVPLPATLPVLAAALALMGWAVRRRRRAGRPSALCDGHAAAIPEGGIPFQGEGGTAC